MMILVTIIKGKFFTEDGKVDTDLVSGLGQMLVWLIVSTSSQPLGHRGPLLGESESMETARLFLMGASRRSSSESRPSWAR